MPRPDDGRFRRTLAWISSHVEFLVALGALALYASTVYPGVGGILNYGDSAKFQFLGRILGQATIRRIR